MKMNWLNLAGLLFLDIILAGFAIGLVALVASAWVVFGSFLISPALVVLVDALGLQDFTIYRMILSCILACLSLLFIYPFCKLVTLRMKEIFSAYWNFHQKNIFRKIS